MDRRATSVLFGVFVVCALFVLYVSFGGSVRLEWNELVNALIGRAKDPSSSVILWGIRLPRAVCALALGASLGVSGAAFQALFRNPLAEPYVVGVSSGAGVGGTLVLLGGVVGPLAVMAGALVGGLAALGLVLALATRGQGHGGIVVIGVVVGSALAGLLTVNLAMANQDSNQVLRWLLGSTTPMDWTRAGALFLATLVAAPLLWRLSRELNVVKTGEFMAARLGVDPDALARRTLVIGGALTSLAVGACGIVGFVGLVAPHLARAVVGSDERWALPTSALTGSVLVLSADIIAQRGLPGGELPLGAVTAVLGAPALFWLLRTPRQPS